jgi:methylated-DNA-[protein]-cysteine S-methyltransferase
MMAVFGLQSSFARKNRYAAKSLARYISSMKNEPHRWAPIPNKFGTFAAWVDGEGRLVRFAFHPKRAAKEDPTAIRDDKALAFVQKQVDEYCDGKCRKFDFELAPQGNDFQLKVWEALTQIPFGETTSYGKLAKKIGYPDAARAVGAANGANPIALIVPCHRVIGADGSLTGFGGGLPLKQALLAHEARVVGMPIDLFA